VEIEKRGAAMTQRILIRHIGGSKANQVDQFTAGSFNEIVGGRDESAGVRFDPEHDDLVSRLHFKILADPSSPSGFKLVDLQSRNGTYLKGQRVFDSTAISHKDIIQLGPGGPEFAFELDPPPASSVKATREVSSLLDGASSSRVSPTRSVAFDATPPTLFGESIEPSRPIGRATVERMLDNTFDKVKHESSKSLWIGLAAVVLLTVVSSVGFVLVRKNSAQSADSARQQQTLLQNLNEIVKKSPQEDAALREQIAQLNAQIKKLEKRDAENSAALNEMLAKQRKDDQPGSTQPQTAAQKDKNVAQNGTNSSAYDEQVKNALDLLKANQVQPAMQAAAQLISQYPQRWESYGVAGTVLRSQSKLPEAKLAYRRALELAPDEVKPQIASVIQQIDKQSAVSR
jgi:pSer/pThr/pTyr-binding forkhead associated (FHA) protein/TolA-binding protein